MTAQAGDVINGYTLLEDFRVVGAGLSKWTFAARDGREYFLKEFLAPTYPGEHAPGSDATKLRKRRRCAAFEAHHRRIQKALASVSGLGGNLIVTLDFFRWGAKYYKVTEKVDAEGLEPGEIAVLPFERQLVLLKTVAHSLKILHDRDIVHGDLKPGNILIKRTELGYTTKLIDFDSSYVAAEPPPPDEIVGTMNYYAPEMVGYVQEAEVAPTELTQRADVFALGLIYTEYLTGAPPLSETGTYQYGGVAARAGEILRLPPTDLPPLLVDLVERMLLAAPAARPTIAEVHATLMRVRPSATATAEATAPTTAAVGPPPPPVVPVPPSAPRVPATPSRLRGKGMRPGGDAPAPAPAKKAAPAARPASGLRGKLLRPKEPGT